MRAWTLFIRLLAVAVCTAVPAAWAQNADLVARNGKLWTVDDANPRAEALAVLDGRFIYVGSNGGVEQHIGPETEVIDLPDLPANLASAGTSGSGKPSDWSEAVTLQQAVEEVEHRLLSQAVERYRNQVEIAEALGVNQSTIARKLKKYGLS